MVQLRVAIGLSGGVDSAVAAWLLKKKGFDVIGVYMNNWDRIEEGDTCCPRTRDEADARYVCEKLQIPFATVDFVKEYWNDVFLKTLENYRHGRTIVPDVICNKEIKFERFHRHAIDNLGADLIATGHYASTSFGDFHENFRMDLGVKLLCGSDPLKDQTPFLCTLQQKQLKRSLFPIGSLTKTEVRQLAIEQGLSRIADKAESMGICFVGKKKNFSAFIDQYIEPRPGKIVDMEGKFIGQHNGIHHFTLGKRIRIQGCNLGYFVVRIDAENNMVYACEGSHHPCLYATNFCVLEPQWIDENPLIGKDAITLECRIQRTHMPIKCQIKRLSQIYLSVQPMFPLRAVANGQNMSCNSSDDKKFVPPVSVNSGVEPPNTSEQHDEHSRVENQKAVAAAKKETPVAVRTRRHFKEDLHMSSPSDSQLSPCTTKLFGKRGKKVTNGPTAILRNKQQSAIPCNLND